MFLKNSGPAWGDRRFTLHKSERRPLKICFEPPAIIP
jgi:hypothetical protein